MPSQAALSIAPSHRPLLALAAPVLLALGVVAGGSLLAQVGGDRGIMPVASSTDIEVRGIEVNVTGDNADDARRKGYEEAQRKAWERIGGPAISDSQLQGMVGAILIEREQIGPRRYVARLGVIFDRSRVGGALGGAGGAARSAPMLTLPVLLSGGTGTMFETRTAWQRVWAETQFGASTIDYVRPEGAGGESLLLTYGQTGRRSRNWWNTILDQFGAADVLVPIARLEYEYPGGPVRGHFTARYGPDNRWLGEFDLRADSPAQVPAMLEQAVTRMDGIFRRALAQGVLRPDPSLALENFELTPELRALLEEGMAAEAAERALAAGEVPALAAEAVLDGAPATPAAAITTITVQAATPDPRSFDSTLGALHGVGGVRGVAVTSTAIGGTSVIQVTYAGDIATLAAALRAAGWRVTEGGNALAIAR
ncbi:heavy-metal-associated domain-containing protein [Alteraurantiacibacter buctensis]|nr:heavy-metal-associated domain-containing protein [Alteraurantiacibacter buctensis]